MQKPLSISLYKEIIIKAANTTNIIIHEIIAIMNGQAATEMEVSMAKLASTMKILKVLKSQPYRNHTTLK
jgi:hypothetical protein